MNTKDILLEQMHACHDQTSWFVTINTALAGLTAGQAAWKDGSTNNSIWQITNHLIFWNRLYLNRFNGIPDPELKEDNDSTFEGERTAGTDADWQTTVEEMDNVMKQWEEVLMQADEAKLDSPMRKNAEGLWGSYLAHINIHTSYHVGQIVTLRKQQGSWNPKQGVN